jgi:hypothetical protein
VLIRSLARFVLLPTRSVLDVTMPAVMTNMVSCCILQEVARVLSLIRTTIKIVNVCNTQYAVNLVLYIENTTHVYMSTKCDKTLHRKLKHEQHEPKSNSGLTEG